ncbi:DNA polymerase domain-containing protein [Cohnella hashimotonis]|uniref:DNA polymerase domain-containing protein n=1 Tax=Cohnella hashimotonis TaxID=2826895 RepID=A0ABT6TGQ0_9BACL|nr:DNA polymerase domain-containing protein [Cohnella hashimotonis]MDI4646023.1 DNA polymerase domain-containing protein [Cohnella hashimotonis]
MSASDVYSIEVEGCEIKVTNPDKPMWPEAGINKALYLQKLVALAPYLLPYCKDRYMTAIRYPDGAGGKAFYQKNAPEPLPPYVRTAVRDQVRYVVADTLPTLLWMGNLAALEFHPSFEYIGGEEPAEWVLDIDPSESLRGRLMEAVSLIGEALEGMGIASVPKTSGATGVQIVIPVRKGYSFAQLRKAGGFVGKYLSEKYPKLFTIERLIKNRKDLIYVDYVQHAAGKSLSAPYTPRGRPEATVSTPLTWDEVRKGADPRAFTLQTIEARLADKGDLIGQVPKQSLEAILQFLK